MADIFQVSLALLSMQRTSGQGNNLPSLPASRLTVLAALPRALGQMVQAAPLARALAAIRRESADDVSALAAQPRFPPCQLSCHPHMSISLDMERLIRCI